MSKHPISELDDRLAAWANGLEDAEELMSKLGHAALARSMKHTPVLTGNLRRSETTRAERDRAYLGSTAEYAQYVHDGTRFVPARPFFEEGIQDAQGEFPGIVERWATDIFGREVAR